MSTGGLPPLPTTPTPGEEFRETMMSVMFEEFKAMREVQAQILQALLAKEDKEKKQTETSFEGTSAYKSTEEFSTPPFRRQSSLFRAGTSYVVDEKNEPVTPKTAVQSRGEVNVMYQEKEVKDSEKMQVLTFASAHHFKEKVAHLNARSVVQVTMQDYISDKILKDLWNYECLNDSEWTWTGSYEALLKLEHDKFMTILARRLRPMNPEEYCKMLRSVLPVIKATHKDGKEVKLSDPNYDKLLFQQFSTFFHVLEETDEFARHGATATELSRLPKYIYGKEDSRDGLGVFAIAVGLLNRFAEDFKRQLGMDRLKDCKSMRSFLDMANTVNRELAKKSLDERVARELIQSKVSFKALTEMMPKEQRDPAYQRNNEVKPQRKIYLVVDDESADLSVINHEPNKVSSSTVYDESGGTAANPDESYVSIENTYPADESIEYTNEICYVKDVKTYKDKPKEKELPCYQHFNGRCTAGENCTYSHNGVKLAEYGQSKLKEFALSKYVSLEDLKKILKEKEAKGNPSFSRPPISSQLQDARRIIPGRHNGQLHLMRHPDMEVQPLEAPTEG